MDGSVTPSRHWRLASAAARAKGPTWVPGPAGDRNAGPDAEQYCGVLGKQDNCQVAVSVSLANATASVPAAYQLYLPESWATDRPRRRAAKVPDTVTFQPKWQLALTQIDRLSAEGVPAAPVVADAGYGVVTAAYTGHRDPSNAIANFGWERVVACPRRGRRKFDGIGRRGL